MFPFWPNQLSPPKFGVIDFGKSTNINLIHTGRDSHPHNETSHTKFTYAPIQKRSTITQLKQCVGAAALVYMAARITETRCALG